MLANQKLLMTQMVKHQLAVDVDVGVVRRLQAPRVRAEAGRKLQQRRQLVKAHSPACSHRHHKQQLPPLALVVVCYRCSEFHRRRYEQLLHLVHWQLSIMIRTLWSYPRTRMTTKPGAVAPPRARATALHAAPAAKGARPPARTVRFDSDDDDDDGSAAQPRLTAPRRK